jgi:general L-amino acid transport system permease protein
MTEVSRVPPSQRSLSWRNPDVRAVVYQIMTVVGVVGTATFLIYNVVTNREKRGLSSGFDFVEKLAGFGIGETVSIPQLERGFVTFFLSIFVGLAAAWLLSKYMQRRGKTVGGDYRLILLTIFFIFGVPTITYYATRASFISETYVETSSYAIALWTGIFNTFKVSIVGCVLATLIGFIVGISRLSSNWLVSLIAATYVEVIRNVPVLLQILFWYFAVLQTLPVVRQSVNIFDVVFINNRGAYLPAPIPQTGAHPFLFAVFTAFVLIYFWARHVRMTQEKTGEQLSFYLPSLGILVVLPGLSWLIFGTPTHWEIPVLKGFNFRGGLNPSPEYAALLMALSAYHGSQVAEIVRSGIQSVSRGQKEAAAALGLRGGFVMRLVVIPQALRVIIPPLTSQYLGVTKNSSLGVAMGYPELVNIGNTTLNQSGQSVEVIAIVMAVYLTFSLLISLVMNWYNERVKLVER